MRNGEIIVYLIKVEEIQDLLKNNKQLREIISGSNWIYQFEDAEHLNTEFQSISYNSKEADKDTLFFCKGASFKEDYLKEAVHKGVTYYVSEEIYDIPNTVGIIVSDIRKVMAVIAKEFYNNPDEKIKIAGITGTKGKTTTAYFTKYVLERTYPNKVALISTINVTLDGKTSVDATLTTPESFDLFKMISQAVENEMEVLIMEVSSQAFKMDRVYGLKFDIGVFLNISPDHIGPNEHPNMEDYFYCKRMLMSNSKYSVINANTKHFDLVYQQAEEYSEEVFAYGKSGTNSHYSIENDAEDIKSFDIVDEQEDVLDIAGFYSLRLLGDFNKENALCAAIVSSLLGSKKSSIQQGLSEALIPGRMEKFTFNETNNVYVDFAHNYISIKKLLDFVVSQHPDSQLTVVLGAPGGKGFSRRKDMGRILSEYEGRVILTEDDPDKEDPRGISEEIAQGIKGSMTYEFIDNREEAITHALETAGSNESIVIAGKGNDHMLIKNGERLPYMGDEMLVKNFISKQNEEKEV